MKKLIAVLVAACSASALAAQTFEDPVRFMDGDEAINVDIGHAAPYYHDLDGDGKRDLLVGQFGEGKLRIYKNKGTDAAPKFDGFDWLKANGDIARVPTGWCVGFTPQVVDFNGDGREDILTGSYSPGHLYLFARNEDGTFAEAEKLKYDNGDLIEHRAATPFAVDWDKDGDLDLLCGDIQGNAWLMENTKEGFKRGVKLQSEGKELKADHGDSQPVAADWNGDGVLDIVFPHGNGKVELYPGEAGKEGIRLGAPETLVEAFDREGEGVRPGMRAKICVTDVNGDGAMDLLLGDYETIQLPAPELSEEEKAEFETLKKERDANSKEMMEIITKVREELLKEFDAESMDDLTEEQKKQFNEKYIKGIRENPEYLEIGKKNREIYEKIRKYQGGYERRGNVWLFQQKMKSPTTGNSEG